jgi:hypothetical protein
LFCVGGDTVDGDTSTNIDIGVDENGGVAFSDIEGKFEISEHHSIFFAKWDTTPCTRQTDTSDKGLFDLGIQSAEDIDDAIDAEHTHYSNGEASSKRIGVRSNSDLGFDIKINQLRTTTSQNETLDAFYLFEGMSATADPVVDDEAIQITLHQIEPNDVPVQGSLKLDELTPKIKDVKPGDNFKQASKPVLNNEFTLYMTAYVNYQGGRTVAQADGGTTSFFDETPKPIAELGSKMFTNTFRVSLTDRD